jgi:hypothetical protein
MDIVPVIAVTGGILMFLIPIAGLTARFALKPIVESIAKLKEIQGGSGSSGDVRQLDARLTMLEQQMQSVESDVRHLAEERDFDRQLSSGK